MAYTCTAELINCWQIKEKLQNLSNKNLYKNSKM